jgi:polysaccharide pyruvyl transferase WcaK-like protein
MKKIRILVTGLCLSRNRGGPAMALSFMGQIKCHLQADFVFAVDPMNIKLEREWAERYGVEVIPGDTILQWLVTQSPVRLMRRLQRCPKGKIKKMDDEVRFWGAVHKEYQDAFKKADCVVNLNGIAFVGDGTRSWLSSLANRTCSIYAKKHKKPFFRFIQSYGPLGDWRVKLLAKLEFKKLPCIMARGRLSASYCKEVSDDVPVYSFPDIAITLPYADDTWLSGFLEQFNLKPKDYIVLSPSAVMASMRIGNDSSLGDKHIAVYAAIARHYISLNVPILFVPHATFSNPAQCDRVICKRVIEKLANERVDTTLCHVVEDELDCRELKALIKGAKLGIVSRYHALVAALSTGVPAISIGWNEKYHDLLDFYGSSEFSVDARIGGPEIVVNMVLKKIENWTDEHTVLLGMRQSELQGMVGKAVKICADWIINVTS